MNCSELISPAGYVGKFESFESRRGAEPAERWEVEQRQVSRKGRYERLDLTSFQTNCQTKQRRSWAELCSGCAKAKIAS